MKISFWGVRGSIPSPGARTVRYGGNTSCITIEIDDSELIILDAGTGIFSLAQELIKRQSVNCSLFITHTHWDHIQGLPFFSPFFTPRNRIDIYGAFNPVSGHPIQHVLNRQMEYCYFPVTAKELAAEINYVTLQEKQLVEIDGVKITSTLMNHPSLSFGYRIEHEGKSVFFTGDHEPLFNIYKPEDDDYEEYEALIEQKNSGLIDAIRGVDVLISDAAYTAAEYPLKQGWGHGTFESCLSLAKKAEVRSVYFTHHDPLRSDDELDAISRSLKSSYYREAGYPPFVMAHEGLEIML